MNKVCFIAEGTKEIGLGHIMRCIAIAEEFIRIKWQVCFFTEGAEGIKVLKEKGIKVIDSLKKVDLIILDRYDLKDEYFSEVKKYTDMLVYLDDENKRDYEVDAIVNGSIVAEKRGYAAVEGRELILGSKFNILRSEFVGVSDKPVSECVKEIMITTGGADIHYTTNKVLRFLRNDKRYSNIIINVIVGPAFKNTDKLITEAAEMKNVILHRNVRNMSEIMMKSDIAISGGGGTLYELCRCGVPTIGICLAENQKESMVEMDKLGVIQFIEDAVGFDEIELNQKLSNYIDDFGLRVNTVELQKNVVDGLGTIRIVERLKLLLEKMRSKDGK